MPFVQGQLRGEPLTVVVRTACAQSGRPLQLEIDHELNVDVVQEEAEPLVFVPLVDFDKLEDPSIIDAF